MKAAPLLIHWHNESPIYSADFEVGGKGRLATAGGDNKVRLWKIETQDDERRVTYLSTLEKHTCAVNVVRWCPRGEMLASAGDDGNILLWVPAENPKLARAFGGEDGLEDKETWRVKRICGGMGTDVYDLAWSPDGLSFVTGSMNDVRIWNASTGACIRQIAEHNNFVQGVAWDPLNEYIATQSSDKSVHIWALKDKQGEFSLHNKFSRMEHNAANPRRISSSSPAPPDFGRPSQLGEHTSHPIGSPVPSVPGTPQSLALPMNPPITSHSRRSSFGASPSMRRSASPAPSLPLPAVMPGHSPSLSAVGLGMRTLAYTDADKFTSFFRRLAFSPDGSLLFTPSGQIKHKPGEFTNTVYIHSRGGFNKDPVAHLPGHKKPSIAVKCSPIYYNHRTATSTTKYITIDTSNPDEEIPALPEPALLTRQPSQTSHSMDPPPLSAPSPAPSLTGRSPKSADLELNGPATLPAGPTPIINLPYRMVYAVATQDAVHIHDTQQIRPLAIVSNLHYATFTDLSWSADGSTLLITSSDGFCSYLSFAAGELGTKYTGTVPSAQNPHPTTTGITSQSSTPVHTPLLIQAPTMTRQPSIPGFMPQSPSKFTTPMNFPGSPARSMSASSIASFAPPPAENTTSKETGEVLMHANPSMGSMPSLSAANSGPIPGNVPLWTPPETPSSNPFPAPSVGVATPSGNHGSVRGDRTHSASSSVSGITGLTSANPTFSASNLSAAVSASSSFRRPSEVDGGSMQSISSDLSRKRDSETNSFVEEEGGQPSKKRRIAPTQVGEDVVEKK